MTDLGMGIFYGVLGAMALTAVVLMVWIVWTINKK
jgi:hypothetical protein